MILSKIKRRCKPDLNNFLRDFSKLKRLGWFLHLLTFLDVFPEHELREMLQLESIVLVMTPAARDDPDIVDSCRRLEIVNDSGLLLNAVNLKLVNAH